jgi:hypothetical protein
VSHRSCFLWLIVAVLSICSSAQSQQPVASPGPTPEVTELKEKALKLLESLAGQVDTLHSAENRARIGSNIAQLLWEHDERRARALFGAAAEDVKAGFGSVSSEDPEADVTLRVFVQLRRDIVMRIANHDTDLALEFLRSTTLPAKLPYDLVDAEKSLSLQLARQAAAKDPQLALRLARESLADKFSLELLPALVELQRRDKSLAKDFHAEIVDKLRKADLREDYMAREFSLRLVQSFTPPAANEETYKSLLETLLKAAETLKCAEAAKNEEDENGGVCSELGSVFQQMVKYFGPRAEVLQAWKSENGYVEITMDPAIQEKFQNGTASEILALAPQYPDKDEQIRWVAMQKALEADNMDQARSIARQAPDQQVRQSMERVADRQEQWKAMTSDQKLKQLQASLDQVQGVYQKVQMILSMAERIGRADRKTALLLLKQAGETIDSIKPGRVQIRWQVQLAMVYCSLKSDRGFAIMQAVVPKLNELVSAAAVLDRFDNDYFRDGEWSMSGEGSLGSLLTTMAQNAGLFAQSDFDRAVNLAGQFERPELRIMAQSKLAQAILEGKTESPVFMLYRTRVID